jgi:hypothetical protein
VLVLVHTGSAAAVGDGARNRSFLGKQRSRRGGCLPAVRGTVALEYGYPMKLERFVASDSLGDHRAADASLTAVR